MDCNFSIHNELKESGNILCPFCYINLENSDEKPQDRLAKYDLCCESPNIINDNSCVVCQSWGVVQGYDSASEYVDFYNNRHKIKRKSVYHRKYHINNILTDISTKYRITYSVDQKNKMRIFSVIGKILPQINGERKRMISVNFIIVKILKMMKLPHSYVKVTKSERTITTYQRYWDQIILLIGDKIKGIIQ